MTIEALEQAVSAKWFPKQEWKWCIDCNEPFDERESHAGHSIRTSSRFPVVTLLEAHLELEKRVEADGNDHVSHVGFADGHGVGLADSVNMPRLDDGTAIVFRGAGATYFEAYARAALQIERKP